MATANTIRWYRTPIARERLKELTERSDAKGLRHAISFLLIFLTTNGVTLYFLLQQMWLPMGIAAYIHCMFHGFLGMGASVHELSHGTAFKTQKLNDFFFRLFAFLSWNSYLHFKESHRRHHMYTGFMDVDKEIKPEPMPFTLPQVLGWFTFDWAQFKRMIWTNLNHAFGNTEVDFFFWCPLLRKEDIKTKKLIGWARLLFIGHLVLLGLFVYFELWILILTVNFGYFFASFLVHGCEIQQHSGLSRNIPDWRVIAYTADFGPVMSFLYWNMNYHAEHHMYAAVPFYNLPKLHEEVEADFPKPIKGYLRGLVHVVRLKHRQKKDPAYRYMPEFPDSATPPKLT